MSKTTFTTSNALTKKAWDEKLFRDTEKESYFMSRFGGKGGDSVLQVKTQLEKTQGDKITFGLRARLSGSGQTEGGILEGNEEALSTYDYGLTLAQYRHAVRDRGEMDRQRAMFSIDDEAKDALKTWGSEKIDQLLFDAVLAAPTKVAYRDGGATGAFTVTGTAATAKAALSATYKINVAFIAALNALAKTGQGRAFTPLRPVRVNGKNYYILLVHPDIAYDLKQDTVLQASWQNAMERSSDNPLFKDAICMWDGVIVHEHENCTKAIDGGGSTVPWAKCVFMGAQALLWAWGKRPEVVQRDFDYGNEHGYGWGFIGAAGKPVFNSLDYGSIGVYLPRTNISG